MHGRLVSISLSSGFSCQVKCLTIYRIHKPVSISLSSGFSFQATPAKRKKGEAKKVFQSRYRAASHVRVAEYQTDMEEYGEFQSRYRAASHFRGKSIRLSIFWIRVSISLSSGFSFQGSRDTPECISDLFVSISLSSGFSFQVIILQQLSCPFNRFNLVIERLFISGRTYPRRRNRRMDSFNLVIERLFISGSSRRCYQRLHRSFNLVIERLFISG